MDIGGACNVVLGKLLVLAGGRCVEESVGGEPRHVAALTFARPMPLVRCNYYQSVFWSPASLPLPAPDPVQQAGLHAWVLGAVLLWSPLHSPHCSLYKNLRSKVDST